MSRVRGVALPAGDRVTSRSTATAAPNFKPWVFKTTDFGTTWKSIASNLPENEPVYVIQEDLKNPNLLFLGTEFAIYYSINGGDAGRSSTRTCRPLPSTTS